MNRWFEITVKAEIDNIENGKKKKVTEKYLVDRGRIKIVGDLQGFVQFFRGCKN